MLKKIFILLISFIGFANFSYSQNVSNEKFVKNEIPKEQVYLHINSSLLFSGEKLLYKFYCYSPDLNNLSELSKVGWVLLVNSDREIIFQHKLALNKGQGNSDFFIPSSLESGSYKILGYTSWMLNAEKNYFEQDITILNPYQKEQQGIIVEQDSVVKKRPNVSEMEPYSNLDLKLNKQVFSTRDKVVITVNNSNNLLDAISISVRRLDSLYKPERVNSANYNNLYQNANWNFSKPFIIPELRGSRYTGVVNLDDNKEINSKELILSFPGEANQLNLVSLDEKGNFNFTLNAEPSGDELLMQITDNTTSDYSINIDPPSTPDLELLNFIKPIIQQNFKESILAKSVNIQIDNAYSNIKADQLISTEDEGYFFDQELIKYNLDEYKRFADVSQTFIEVIENGRIVRNGDGSHSIMVRNKNTNGEFSLPALLIVDGVVVQDHDLLISYASEKILSISILRSKYIFGPELFQGVVVAETKKKDFPEEFRTNYIRSAKIIPYQKDKKYYAPNYEKDLLERIPDYRYQLLWKPEIQMNLNENELNFYTSDLEGIFEINLEGFTTEGKPVSISKTFEVRE